jgi:D-alanyl-D-alanine endopeptidase (penicillin-binding protein 7)
MDLALRAPRPWGWVLACGLGILAVDLREPPAAEAAPAAAVKGRSINGGAARAGRRAPARRAAPARRKRAPVERRVPAMRGNLPNIQALGALIVDVDTGEELFARKADQVRPIASVSKLLAALVVVERGLELEELTTIKKVDADVARGGAKSRLLEGMTLTNRDLLHAALLGSDNRAVSALGRAVNLGASPLAAAMTRKAAELGLKHTRFREPTGLSPENVSTARETIAMLRTAMAHPLLGSILRRIEYDAHPVARPAIKYVNTHKPAHRSNTQVLGGKTGYNDAARYCLVLVCRIDGRTIGMSFLGTEGELTRFGDAARTADWIVSRKPRAPARAPGAPPPSPAGPPGPAPSPAGPAPAPPAVAATPPQASPPAAILPPAATTAAAAAGPIPPPPGPPTSPPPPGSDESRPPPREGHPAGSL